MNSVIQIKKAIETLFEQADALARQTSFVQRERPAKVSGKRFAATVVLGLLQRGEVSLSDLKHFATHVNMNISQQGLHDRFTESAATFLEGMLNVAFTQLVVADPVSIPLLQRFREVIVEDSSTFRLPDECQTHW